jgi:hypothetical protein
MVGDLAAAASVAIQDGVAVWIRFRKGFLQLLRHPIGRRMRRNVEAQEPAGSESPAIVLLCDQVLIDRYTEAGPLRQVQISLLVD